MQAPRALVAILLVIALASTVGWIVTARRNATANQATAAAAEARPHSHHLILQPHFVLGRLLAS